MYSDAVILAYRLYYYQTSYSPTKAIESDIFSYITISAPIYICVVLNRCACAVPVESETMAVQAHRDGRSRAHLSCLLEQDPRVRPFYYSLYLF